MTQPSCRWMVSSGIINRVAEAKAKVHVEEEEVVAEAIITRSAMKTSEQFQIPQTVKVQEKCSRLMDTPRSVINGTKISPAIVGAKKVQTKACVRTPICAAGAKTLIRTEQKKRILQETGSAPATLKLSYEYYVSLVESNGTSILPGHDLKLETFHRVLPKCVASGAVSQDDADFVLHGITKGFDLGVDESLMGHVNTATLLYKVCLDRSCKTDGYYAQHKQ